MNGISFFYDHGLIDPCGERLYDGQGIKVNKDVADWWQNIITLAMEN